MRHGDTGAAGAKQDGMRLRDVRKAALEILVEAVPISVVADPLAVTKHHCVDRT